jgi:hypothetical protein
MFSVRDSDGSYAWRIHQNRFGSFHRSGCFGHSVARVSPLILSSCMAEYRGDLFFLHKKERLGGENVTMFKFRSMTDDQD